MGASDQPNQLSCGAVLTAGVLTQTSVLYMNPTVATGMDDDTSTPVTTVEADANGVVTITVTVTPASAITGCNGTTGSGIRNPVAPFA